MIIPEPSPGGARPIPESDPITRSLFSAAILRHWKAGHKLSPDELIEIYGLINRELDSSGKEVVL